MIVFFVMNQFCQEASVIAFIEPTDERSIGISHRICMLLCMEGYYRQKWMRLAYILIFLACNAYVLVYVLIVLA